MSVQLLPHSIAGGLQSLDEAPTLRSSPVLPQPEVERTAAREQRTANSATGLPLCRDIIFLRVRRRPHRGACNSFHWSGGALTRPRRLLLAGVHEPEITARVGARSRVSRKGRNQAEVDGQGRGVLICT